MRKNSIKNNRINDAVKRELSEIIRLQTKDPRISPMTSVTDVQVATDLKTCKVAISVLGDTKAKEDTMAGLKSSAGFIRRQLAHTLNLRNTPELYFRLDESMEYAVKMSRIINEVRETDTKRREEAGEINLEGYKDLEEDGFADDFEDDDFDEEGDF